MDSPLARIQIPNKRGATPRLEIPKSLTLPDGRTFDTRALLQQRTRSENYNLRSKNPRTPTASKTVTRKYVAEDWTWMLTATIDEIMARYQTSNQYAQTLRSKARAYVRKHDV